MKSILLILMLSGVSLPALSYGGGGGGFSSSGGALLGLNLIIYNDKYDSTPNAATGAVTGNTETRITNLDIKLGYLSSPLYVGAIYSSRTNDARTPIISGNEKRSFVGVTVGYHNNGYYLDASYLMNGKYSDYAVGTGELNAGTGIAIDFGYLVPIAGNFNLDVQLSYKTLTFKKYTPVGGTEVATTWNQTEYYPMLGFAFIF